jgi:transposase-like protein
MPKKVDKIAINNENLDRRVKLTKDQKEEIVYIREEEGLSLSAIARMFGVSKRTIHFICCPEKLSENIARRNERGGSKQYYNREEWAVTMKEHREYKDKLLKEGLIK